MTGISSSRESTKRFSALHFASEVVATLVWRCEFHKCQTLKEGTRALGNDYVQTQTCRRIWWWSRLGGIIMTVWVTTEFLQGLERAVLTFWNKMPKMLFFLARRWLVCPGLHWKGSNNIPVFLTWITLFIHFLQQTFSILKGKLILKYYKFASLVTQREKSLGFVD